MSYPSNENLSLQNMQSDRPLLIAVIFLVVIGLMAIFSASAPKCVEMGVNPARFLVQQILGVAIGFIGLKFLSNFHYRKLLSYTMPFTLFVIIMLVMVKVAGVTVNGAQRWINIGPMSMQPSEFAKPAVVMLLAAVFSKDTILLDEKKISRAFWKPELMLLLPVLLCLKVISLVILNIFWNNKPLILRGFFCI